MKSLRNVVSQNMMEVCRATGAEASTLCLIYPIGCWGNAGVLATNQKLAFDSQQCWGSRGELRSLPAFMKYGNKIVKTI